MLNVRKLKQDFSQNVLREGKELFTDKKVTSAKIVSLDTSSIRISAKVEGQFENGYECEIEIDRVDCETIDSDCDCPYHYDCQHLAALLFYLEEHLDKMLVSYSKDSDLVDDPEQGKDEILEAVKDAVNKEEKRKDLQFQKELMEEYILASGILATSPFFLNKSDAQVTRASIMIIYSFPESKDGLKPIVELQFALRLPSRSKPLHIPNAKKFLDGIRYEEALSIGGKKYLFTADSFSEDSKDVVRMLIDYARVHDRATTERGQKCAYIETKSLGLLLAKCFKGAYNNLPAGAKNSAISHILPGVYVETLDTPLHFSPLTANFNMNLEYIKPPASKILINPTILAGETSILLEDALFFECASPSFIYDGTFYLFSKAITRQHLLHLMALREITICKPLFGTFIENGLGRLASFANITGKEIFNEFTTLPYVKKLKGECNISYLDGELEATMNFIYNDFKIPATPDLLTGEHLEPFAKDSGLLARNLFEEKQLINSLFLDFLYDKENGSFVAKSEKKIVEFMTERLPEYKEKVTFNCPQNLLDQFIYDTSKFTLSLTHTDRLDSFALEINVDGDLKGIRMDSLWDCILSKRSYLELSYKKKGAGKEICSKMHKILVLNLKTLAKVVNLFDELGIKKLDDHTITAPIWSIANIDESQFKNLPVTFHITKQLKEIRSQMLGEKTLTFSPIPKTINATLRPYQTEGVNYLERLRNMYLGGILADDMGLGKTLQTIVTLEQSKSTAKTPSIIICPTSLLYNWKEEFTKFNPNFKILVIDGIPNHRKKLIAGIDKYDAIVTSYSLLQKDIEHYGDTQFHYSILDEAQHIKNRSTRNAKSVKMLKSNFKLILSGTPIENSLDELWSLFDYLMPNFLNTYDRFLEKYVRQKNDDLKKNLEYLKKKVSPFILRRMKSDVLDDLPPVSEIVYHSRLSKSQKELYNSYATSAKDELTKLVERDGFDKVQIHVLATLTRLKQICCHPAIFAKDANEAGDSAKFDMLLELLQTLIDGGHKTVIFSQYTKMLKIMRDEFEANGIKYSYLDGSSKNRMGIVKEFNQGDNPIFLVSLKAGGTGLNLTGADTVIHYDMWWNPAVENQATDRVHRMGQKQNVSVYKLVTLNTIEEKIVAMQKKKMGVVKKIVSTDEDVISKLTWEDVLDLLKTND
ncbi:MAG: RNA polymerase-associated protein RapA [Chlamydiia bacterium]|nr:RNA polymerase-associated protein RapA [Chlamydiia bacterium]MCH9618769.1 RNA polymerase-associated protein RapA [Chlamydiia bacterium]MCH9624430.1 RNA polymerase-associated protein RapA [Chlamydiia bacterium]